VQSVSWLGARDVLNAVNADSGHLAAFLNRRHPGHADTNLDAKAKREVLFGRLGEVAQVGSAARPLTPPQPQG
jgi:hypothetical protein